MFLALKSFPKTILLDHYVVIQLLDFLLFKGVDEIKYFVFLYMDRHAFVIVYLYNEIESSHNIKKRQYVHNLKMSVMCLQ